MARCQWSPQAAIRQPAPGFSGMAWWNGEFKKIDLADFKGKWVVLFFWPLDFTFVCPTEIVQFSDLSGEFANHSILIKINIYRLPGNRMLSRFSFFP